MKQKIYHFLAIIPRGKVVTYKYLADKFGTHPRAIGKIMNCNQDRVKYPCYKVIRSDRTLGGYALELGEKIKRLEKDGIVLEDGKVLDRFVIG